MRSLLVSALLGLSLTACSVGDLGGGGGGGGGDGGGGGGGPDAPALVPRLDVMVDKPTVSTELKTTTMVTVSFQASGGFSGPVNLTASVVDGASAPLTAWTVALDQSTVNLAADGTATVVATLSIPSENLGLAGTVKIDATTNLGTHSVTSAVTALNQVTIPMTVDGNDQCVYPPNGAVRMTVGSKLRFKNNADQNITIHMEPETNGLNHQNDPGSAPGGVYEQTLTGAPGQAISWYCHAPGPNTGGAHTIQPVAAL